MQVCVYPLVQDVRPIRSILDDLFFDLDGWILTPPSGQSKFSLPLHIKIGKNNGNGRYGVY
jgi:hypothetical protein